MHPIIRAEMRNEIKKVKSPYCICVIPLLIESGDIDFIDRVLVVESPIELQIERAKKRDNMTDESLAHILKSQASASDRRKIANDIITNDSDLKSLEAQVLKLHRFYSNYRAML